VREEPDDEHPGFPERDSALLRGSEGRRRHLDTRKVRDLATLPFLPRAGSADSTASNVALLGGRSRAA
jgi:hypothetical protein